MDSCPNPCRILALPGHDAECAGWAIAVLTWSGHRVDRAESAAAGLALLRSARYDLIVLGYGSSPDDRQLAIDMLQDPDDRLPTLILVADAEDFIPPPQTHFVPTAFLEPGFSSAELLRLVEKLRQYRK